MSENNAYHIPVLYRETLEYLNVRPSGVYVDCTFGGGGHSRGILELLNEKGRLFAFDQDEDAQKNIPKDDRLTFIPQNFKYLRDFLRVYGVERVDGVLADLGVSSHQFDESERGFSIRYDGPLDMRMDRRVGQKASDLLMSLSEKELQEIFSKYGEVTNAKTLANLVVEKRALSLLPDTIDGFKAMLSPIVKGNPNRYFAQVFQALRIVVNAEMEALELLLAQIPTVLNTGGRCAIITFHSIEDRMVKTFFKQGTWENMEENPLFNTTFQNPLKIVTKKPIVPNIEEVQRNSRSRSAKLRVAEKK